MWQGSLCFYLWVLLSSKLAYFSGMPFPAGGNVFPPAQNLYHQFSKPSNNCSRRPGEGSPRPGVSLCQSLNQSQWPGQYGSVILGQVTVNPGNHRASLKKSQGSDLRMGIMQPKQQLLLLKLEMHTCLRGKNVEESRASKCNRNMVFGVQGVEGTLAMGLGWRACWMYLRL